MTDKPENPKAFPLVVPLDFQFAEAGMTLRDHFAGLALMHHSSRAAILSDDPLKNAKIAKSCYDLADAMLKERA